MNHFSRHSLVRGFALGVGFACLASTAALAQSGNDPAPSWLQQRVTGLEQKLAFFGTRDEPNTGEPNIQTAQSSMADIAVRLDRLENQMRQLNGRIEELQFQGKKNEDALKRAQDDTDFRLKDLENGKGGGGGGGGAGSGSGGGGGSTKPQRRGDAGDYGTGGGGSGSRGGDISVGSSNGGGPGAPPATLGQTRSSGGGGDQIGGLIDQGPGDDPNGPMSIRPPGAGGGSRSSGGDYGGGGRSSDSGVGGGGDDSRVASREPPNSVTAGSGSPRDQFDLGVGFVQRRNYDQAEATFKDFLRSYPNDAKAPEATYWLGESLYQRKKYADAVENFLKIYNTAPNSAKAPESMLKLGMALNGMGKKEEACGTLDAAGKKYARIKPQSDREFKRLSC